ncbi:MULTISPECIES: pyruvate formate-lyase-activating protein [Carnobacterium]|jgi:pyruvate formate lyase activating enzyme|uniref:Pyruvate formate-lyase-activating enzyme n=2 Tax=Carnobacterium maltaromaticum TaxID=2751 RepID=K8ER63_CARML|nr:pyruvate formate-lyase-activating protein [Carnobacterium maltaromaticum]AOA01983.1 pyruvate formate-lyase 1-activating enzyme [Carnobacterium maltaromaticum]KRN64566.1 pyruvate formate-lyase activating enzyme [Carnobacterium maltaromaticum DSM 20342]KRN74266.1 pyruvate formate-lyase activating enzyme [Carnobacterium maltaromaticum]KRN87753.1 pyruvate formate-lyase activating enzyme [Carnobacterium maltaromaticum]MBC9788689.1 pyruvate formate lyase-activating protein [Carnobacterium maltaro
MSQPVIGTIHSTENFGTVDGPGVRFIVFTQGCRMRCQFCHNPDTWKIGGGKERSTDDILAEALRYKTYWGKDGGITVSGGEPLLQMEFLIDLFKKAKAAGVHTTLDSCGKPFTREEPFFSQFEELMKYTDLILFDIKHIDDEQHKVLTSLGNSNILEMAKYLSEINQPVWIRHVLVPQRTDYDEYLIRLSDFIKTLNNVKKVEVLPYHTMGLYKYQEMGIPYPLEGIETPSTERVNNAKKILQTADYTGYLN